MIISIDLSQDIFAIVVLTALKSSFKHGHKHVLRWLRLYGDQALKLRLGLQSTQQSPEMRKLKFYY